MDPRKVFGKEGEAAAVSHLLLHGADILMRNFRCRYGELVSHVGVRGSTVSYLVDEKDIIH